MIDVTTARRTAIYTQLTLFIFLLLTRGSGERFTGGYAMEKRKSRSWLHMVLYAAVISVTIYAVLDLEYPRFGWIRLTEADKPLVLLRDSIH